MPRPQLIDDTLEVNPKLVLNFVHSMRLKCQNGSIKIMLSAMHVTRSTHHC